MTIAEERAIQRVDASRTQMPSVQRSFDDLQKMAASVAKSQLFACRTTEEALTLMMLADSEGLHPIEAMRRYHIIEHRPCKRADAIQAEFESRGGLIMWHQRTDAECSATFFRHSDSASQGGLDRARERYKLLKQRKDASTLSMPGEITVIWTLEDAIQKGIAVSGNGGLKSIYQKYPRPMLHARCVSEGVRSVDPGSVVGLYPPEEVMDFDDAPSNPSTNSHPAPKVKQDIVEGTIIETPIESPQLPPADIDQRPAHEVIREKAIKALIDRGYVQTQAEKVLSDIISISKRPIEEWDDIWRKALFAKINAGKYDPPKKETPSPAPAATPTAAGASTEVPTPAPANSTPNCPAGAGNVSDPLEDWDKFHDTLIETAIALDPSNDDQKAKRADNVVRRVLVKNGWVGKEHKMPVEMRRELLQLCKDRRGIFAYLQLPKPESEPN